MKVVPFPSIPANFIISFINSLNLSLSKPFTISTYTSLYSSMKEANLVNDCLPLPPTPISIAFPLGYLSTLNILNM